MFFAIPYTKRTQTNYLGSFSRSLETTQGQFYIVEALDDFVQTNNLHYFTQSGRRGKKFQLSASALKRQPIAYQTPDSLAINDTDLAAVQQEESTSLDGKVLNFVSKLGDVLDCQPFAQLQQSDWSNSPLAKN